MKKLKKYVERETAHKEITKSAKYSKWVHSLTRKIPQFYEQYHEIRNNKLDSNVSKNII